MKIFKVALRIASILLSACVLTIGVLLLMREPNIFTLKYLVLNCAGYLLILPIVIGLCNLSAKSGVSSFAGGWLLYPLYFILAFALVAPLLLVGILIHIIGICRSLGNKERRLDEHHKIREDERKRIYLRSAAKALQKILDKEDSGDVILDDGEKYMRFKQVALIRLGEKQYALLSPVREGDKASAVAYAYAIDPYPGTTILSLLPINNERLYRRIYAAYEQLLDERV